MSMLVGMLVMCCVVNVWAILALLPVVVLVCWIQRLAVKPMRDLQRIDSLGMYNLSYFFNKT